jgi:Leucine-rich repeat (LRR) protein
MKYIKTYEQSKGITFQEWLKYHPKNLKVTEIDCSYSNLIDLDGIEQFTNLKGLRCYYNKLTQLPDLPDTLEILGCSENQLTSLPDLPDTLKILYCDNNQLTSLPDLPDTLERLNCSHNKLIFLPDLPDTLKYLGCYGNKLPYNDLEGYWKWFKKTYPEKWRLKQDVKKYNL